MRGVALFLVLLSLAALVPDTLAQSNTTIIVAPAPVATAPIAGVPDLELVGPTAALPGKARLNIFLEVANLGPGAARNVRVLVQPSGGGLVVVGQIDRSLDDIPEGQSRGLSVRVATPDTSGAATITLTFSFNNNAGTLTSLTRTVNIQIAPPQSSPLDISFHGGAITAGEHGDVALTVTNPSTRPIVNLDLHVQPGERNGLIGSTQENLVQKTSVTPGNGSSLILHAATLGPGETVTVHAPMVASLKPQDLLPFSVFADYTLDGYARAQIFDFGVRVVGSVHLRVLDARLGRSDQGPVLAGTIVNTGTGTAWNPRVSVAEGSGLRAVRPDLIADLKPNQATDFIVPVEQVGEATAGAPLVTVDWNDDFGTVTTSQVAGQAEPMPPAQPGFWARVWSGIKGPWGILLLAVVVLLIGANVIRHIERAHHEAEEAEAARESGEPRRPPKGKARGGGRRPKPGH